MKIGCWEVPKLTDPSLLWPAEWKAPAPLWCLPLGFLLTAVSCCDDKKFFVALLVQDYINPRPHCTLLLSNEKWSRRKSGHFPLLFLSSNFFWQNIWILQVSSLSLSIYNRGLFNICTRKNYPCNTTPAKGFFKFRWKFSKYLHLIRLTYDFSNCTG